MSASFKVKDQCRVFSGFSAEGVLPHACLGVRGLPCVHGNYFRLHNCEVGAGLVPLLGPLQRLLSLPSLVTVNLAHQTARGNKYPLGEDSIEDTIFNRARDGQMVRVGTDFKGV